MRTRATQAMRATACLVLLLGMTTAMAAAQGMPEGKPEGMRACMQRMMEHMAGTPEMKGSPGMGMASGMGMTAVPNLPPVKAFANGEPIFFVHPEASDPEIAQTLSFMMGSPVAIVPSLAMAPDEMLADLYVFTNGTSGMGPLGFQPDVFDAMPGEPGYSPLRRLNLVTWQDPAKARVLKSAAEVREAQANDEITIEQSEVVINAPVLKWGLGRR